MGVFLVDGREENERGPFGLFALADQSGCLVTIETRHQDIQQDNSEILLQQAAQRLLAGLHRNHFRNWRENFIDRQQIPFVIVDCQNACLCRGVHQLHELEFFRRVTRRLLHRAPVSLLT